MNDQNGEKIPSASTMIRRAAQLSKQMTPAERWAVLQASREEARQLEVDLDRRAEVERTP